MGFTTSLNSLTNLINSAICSCCASFCAHIFLFLQRRSGSGFVWHSQLYYYVFVFRKLSMSGIPPSLLFCDHYFLVRGPRQMTRLFCRLLRAKAQNIVPSRLLKPFRPKIELTFWDPPNFPSSVLLFIVIYIGVSFAVIFENMLMSPNQLEKNNFLAKKSWMTYQQYLSTPSIITKSKASLKFIQINTTLCEFRWTSILSFVLPLSVNTGIIIIPNMVNLNR